MSVSVSVAIVLHHGSLTLNKPWVLLARIAEACLATGIVVGFAWILERDFPAWELGLLRRGWIAALAPDGAPNMDILVTDENNKRLCAIQVKTRRDVGSDKGWHMKPKHETMVVDDLFYVFVDVGKRPSDQTTCYIMPSRVVADCLKRCHQVWLDTPGRGGNPHKDSNVRRLRPDHSSINPITPEDKAIIDEYRSGWLDHYREEWVILGLPEANSF